MEEIKELIAKIQQEGIKTAQEKAHKIEEEAHKSAAEIIRKAKTEADKIINTAQDNVKAKEKTMQDYLRQSGRDLILLLKKEINSLLEKIILKEVRQALSIEELEKMLSILVKEAHKKDSAHIEVILNKEDLKKLSGGFLEKLKSEVKKGLLVQPSEDISSGFIISYDQGKSYFDFSDKALAEYIAGYLKPQLSEILK